MMARISIRPALACAVSLTLALSGCRGSAEQPGSPEQVAREALGVQQDGKEKTAEAKRDVIVEQTTRVIDSSTGQVLKTEEKQTPVTITEHETVEHDVDVNAGKPNTTVK